MTVPLARAHDAARFGGKAAGLSIAVRAGLPVPPGFALDPATVSCAVAGDENVLDDLVAAAAALGPSVAVRSSAIGEDGAQASYAGQHTSVLGVQGRDSLVAAVAAVHASAHTPGALAYRERIGLDGPVEIAIVVQAVIDADVAGVLFTRDPLSGADERVIEASWGLGEAVVSGLITPDTYWVARGGAVRCVQVGDKDVAVELLPGGGTGEVVVGAARATERCLTDTCLRELDALASCCEEAFCGPRDIEWALSDRVLFLLQCRAVTV